MAFQGVFEEKGEEWETFNFLTIEALQIGHTLNWQTHQDSLFPCWPHAEAFVLLCNTWWGCLVGVWWIHFALLRVDWKDWHFLTNSQTVVAVASWGNSSRTKRLESQSIGVYQIFLTEERLLWHLSGCLETENEEEVSLSPEKISFEWSKTVPAASVGQGTVVQHEVPELLLTCGWWRLERAYSLPGSCGLVGKEINDKKKELLEVFSATLKLTLPTCQWGQDLTSHMW